jgi:hypothetical protein
MCWNQFDLNYVASFQRNIFVSISSSKIALTSMGQHFFCFVDWQLKGTDWLLCIHPVFPAENTMAVRNILSLTNKHNRGSTGL